MTADGGHGDFAQLDAIAAYIDRVCATDLDYAVIHEADFLTRHPSGDAVWRLMRNFKDDVDCPIHRTGVPQIERELSSASALAGSR